MQKDIELSGKLGKKRGNTKSKDCKTKTLILGCVAEKPATVGEIFEISGFTGTYKSLAGMIRTYHDYGYLYRNGHKPFTYTISDLGMEHLENPRLAREALIERRQANAVAVTRRFLLGMDEESRNNFLIEMGIEPVEQHVTIAKNEPAKPDKVTVKAVNENIKVIDSKPATDLPKPSVGLSGVMRVDVKQTPEYLALAKKLEEAEDKIERLEFKSERDKPNIMTLPTPTGNYSEPKRYDKYLIKYRGKVLDSKFFSHVYRKLYFRTDISTQNLEIGRLNEAYNDFKKVKKGEVVLLSSAKSSYVVDHDLVKEFTDEDFKRYKPTLKFLVTDQKDENNVLYKAGVYVVISKKNFIERLCDLPLEIASRPVKIVHH